MAPEDFYPVWNILAFYKVVTTVDHTQNLLKAGFMIDDYVKDGEQGVI